MWQNHDCPCKKDCPDRVPACHGSCEKYKAWAAKRAEDKKAYAIYKERYMSTNAQKKAIWLRYRRDHYGKATKKFSQ
jgi:flavorubredoxin